MMIHNTQHDGVSTQDRGLTVGSFSPVSDLMESLCWKVERLKQIEKKPIQMNFAIKKIWN